MVRCMALTEPFASPGLLRVPARGPVPSGLRSAPVATWEDRTSRAGGSASTEVGAGATALRPVRPGLRSALFATREDRTSRAPGPASTEVGAGETGGAIASPGDGRPMAPRPTPTKVGVGVAQ